MAVSISYRCRRRSARRRQLRPLLESALIVHLSLLPVVMLTALWVMPPRLFAVPTLVVSLAGWGGLWLLIRRGLAHHPYDRFGLANTLTACRAMLLVAIAAMLPMIDTLSATSPGLWLTATGVLLALVLDGVDGHVARSRSQQSAFGARFDMEVDAALALILAILLWQLDKCGSWVLGLGIMRYVFVLAAYRYPALSAPLYPSQRRKVICVVQIGSLCAMLVPVVPASLACLIGVIALVLLAGSFLRDTLWLLSRPTL